jgi:O-antigen/teichoic acid export membrane protein
MFANQIFVATVGILNGILMARLLGPAGKGEYYVLLLLPSTMMVLLQLGLPQGFLFYTARGQTVRLISTSFLVTAALSGLGFAIVLVLLPVIQAAILHGIPLSLVFLALLALPFMLEAPLLAGIVMGRQAVRWYAGVTTLQPVLSTVLLVISLVVLGQGVAGGIAVFTIVMGIHAVAFFVAALRVGRSVPRPTIAPLRQLLAYGLRFYPGSLSGFFSYRMDVYLIALLLADPAADIGYYSMAVALAEVIFLFPKAVASIFFPHVAGSPRDDADRQVALVSRVTLLVTGLGAIILIPCAVALILTLLPAFQPSIPPFLVLLPGAVALSGSNVVGGYVTGIGRPGTDSLVSVGALAVNIVANLLLIPRFGILGAASASLISYTLSSVALTAIAARLSSTSMWRFWIPDLDDLRFVVATSRGTVQRMYGMARREVDIRRSSL